MRPEFSSSFFAGNRKKLRTLFTGTAPVVLTANGLLQRNSDTTYPFRQDSNFWYLTGIEEPDIILVMDKSKEYLIVPDRDASRAAFDGTVNDLDLTEVSGIHQVYGEKEGWSLLSSRLKKIKHLATLSAAKPYEERLGIYTNPARASLIHKIKSYNDTVELLDIRNHLSQMRMQKQSVELMAIKTAIGLSIKAFAKMHASVASAHNESDLQIVVDKFFASQRVGHAYQPIIAAGGNACTLHYVDNNAPIESGSLVLIDAGAEYSNYSSDITRTFATQPPTKRQNEVYQAVLEVQLFAYSQLKPGITIRNYEAKIEHFMGEKLRELGLIKVVDHESVRKYYPHATSHYLGLDTHDIGDYDRPLEDGMVLTVEPGIYIPEESIGVRIEDDVLIKNGRVEILSKACANDLV